MASAMMADTTGGVGTVADLAPTMTMGLKVSFKQAKWNCFLFYFKCDKIIF